MSVLLIENLFISYCLYYPEVQIALLYKKEKIGNCFKLQN